MSAASAPTAERPPVLHRRVLVVEDQPDSRETLRMLLELWGHEVEAAGDGRQGVEMGLSWHPDTAVVDIGLPLLDGYQVARLLRAALHDVLLIALTSYNRPEDRRRAFDAGFDVHLSKPVEPDALQHLLAERR
jgi:two-component system, sensor histidine kinase